MSEEDKVAFAKFVQELEKATERLDIVWDVELLGDAREAQRRYTAGIVFSNGAIGCVTLQHEGRMFVNSHEYSEPEVNFRKLWILVSQPNAHVLQLATAGLEGRAGELCESTSCDLNSMGQS